MIYRQLPEELQRYIRSYFYLWERFGLEKPRYTLRPDAYYTRIRHTHPRVYRNGINYFGYRRQRDQFQWDFFITYSTETQDFWVVRMRPQWESKKQSIVPELARDRFYEAIDAPAPLLRATVITQTITPLICYLELEYEVRRSSLYSPPTRQASLDTFIHYVRRLADIVEITRKKMTTKQRV